MKIFPNCRGENKKIFEARHHLADFEESRPQDVGLFVGLSFTACLKFCNVAEILVGVWDISRFFFGVVADWVLYIVLPAVLPG